MQLCGSLRTGTRCKILTVNAVYRLLVPESPRWLAVHGHHDAAVTMIRKICRTNCRQLPDDFSPACFIEEVRDQRCRGSEKVEKHEVTTF